MIILIQTPHGTLQLEILDPEVEVTIKGTELTLSGTDIEPISLKTGEKKLLITRGDLSFETDSFTLKKGMETRVKVELVSDKLIVNGDGRVIAEQPIQRRGGTTSITEKDSVSSNSTTSNGIATPPRPAADKERIRDRVAAADRDTSQAMRRGTHPSSGSAVGGQRLAGPQTSGSSGKEDG